MFGVGLVGFVVSQILLFVCIQHLYAFVEFPIKQFPGKSVPDNLASDAADLIERMKGSQSVSAKWCSDEKLPSCSTVDSMMQEETARGAEHDPELAKDMKELFINVCFRNVLDLYGLVMTFLKCNCVLFLITFFVAIITLFDSVCKYICNDYRWLLPDGAVPSIGLSFNLRLAIGTFRKVDNGCG